MFSEGFTGSVRSLSPPGTSGRDLTSPHNAGRRLGRKEGEKNAGMEGRREGGRKGGKETLKDDDDPFIVLTETKFSLYVARRAHRPETHGLY
jgi:hypothetical protein